jgi:hypothetical protein
MDIFQSIIDILNQEYGKRGTVGSLYLIYFLTPIVLAMHAKELAKKYKTLKATKESQLDLRELSASLFTTEGGEQVKFFATLNQDKFDTFHLIVEKSKNANTSTVANIKKNSLDEIERYLRSETKFILADFK